MRKILLLFLLVLFGGFSSAAYASDTVVSDNVGRHPQLVLYSGVTDVLDSDNSVQFGVEYRSATIWRGLRPTFGANIDTNRAFYGYAGFNYDFVVADDYFVTPNFVAGLYYEGSGKDLGHAVEFRSGIEVARRLGDGGSRIGLAFNHISNAGIGDDNPGSENLLLIYSRPVSFDISSWLR